MHSITKIQAIKFFVTSALLLWYFGYLVGEFGFAMGLHCLILTWTFFILCTPSTNGGVIIDIPFHVLTGKRMLYSEIVIWIGAIAYNFVSYFLTPGTYYKKSITHLLYAIISQPWPLWIVITLCSAGTFFTLLVANDDRCIVEPLYRIISKLFSIISLLITLVLCYYELVIIINTHGNP